VQFNFRGESNILISENVAEYESQFEGLQASSSRVSSLIEHQSAEITFHSLDFATLMAPVQQLLS